MTAKTIADALALEAALGADRIARIKAEAFRAGLEAAADFVAQGEGPMWQRTADAIRSIPVPEKL